MYYSFCFLVLIFFIYSFIGYVVEITSISSKTHKLNLSRGYLIGPYLPIFGFGGVFLTSFLSKYKDDIIVLFIMSLTVCSLLEYFVSLVMERIFKLRWWDYSDRLLNINGRICLENGIKFGIGGVLLNKFFHPLLVTFLNSFSVNLVYILGTILFVIMFLDFLISTYTILQLKIDLNVYTDKDSTMRIRREVLESVKKYRFFHRRLYQAFPNLTENKGVSKFKKLVEKRKRCWWKKK